MIKIFMAITLAVVAASTTVEEYPTDEPIDSFITTYNNPGAIIADAKDDEPIFIEVEEEEETIEEEWTGPKLTKSAGRIQGPDAEETWYNLPMGRCIDMMRNLGYTTEEYPYWVRPDGAKMLGEYVMVGANTYQIPKGTIVNTSLGKGIVADHCVAAQSKNLYDIAVTW